MSDPATETTKSSPLFAEAAAEISARIRRDLERASEEVAPLVRCIDEHLYEPGFDVNKMRRSCAATQKTIKLFEAELGRLPKAYITRRRMQTAELLLATTRAKVWKIAEDVGYRRLSAFSNAFKSWCGQPPSQVRQAARGEAAADQGDPGWLADERRALAGVLENGRLRALLGRLEHRYPAAAPAPPLDAPPPIAGAFRRRLSTLDAVERQALERWTLTTSRRPAGKTGPAAEKKAKPSAAEEANCLRQAAAPPLAALGRAEARAARPLKPVIAELRRNVFEPGYSATELKETLGLADNELMIALHREIGLPPTRSIQEVRLETAARLLDATPLAVEAIVSLVGYANHGWFRHLFRRWSGLNPAPWRDAVRRAAARVGPPPAAALGWRYWRKAYAGGMSAAETRRLMEYLVEAAATSRPEAGPTARRERLCRTFELASPLAAAQLMEQIARLAAELRLEPGVNRDGRRLAVELTPALGVELSDRECRLAVSIETAYGQLA